MPIGIKYSADDVKKAFDMRDIEKSVDEHMKNVKLKSLKDKK